MILPCLQGLKGAGFLQALVTHHGSFFRGFLGNIYNPPRFSAHRKQYSLVLLEQQEFLWMQICISPSAHPLWQCLQTFFLLHFFRNFEIQTLNMPTRIIAALQMKVLDYAKRMVGLARFWFSIAAWQSLLTFEWATQAGILSWKWGVVVQDGFDFPRQNTHVFESHALLRVSCSSMPASSGSLAWCRQKRLN